MEEQMYDIIETETLDDGTKVEVLQFKKLSGSSDLRVANHLFFAANSGMSLKMVRITLTNSHIRLEPGALYFMKGNLEMKSNTGGGIKKGLARKMLTGESMFVSEIHGSGEVYLEPSFGHFVLYRIDSQDKAIICDKGLFYAGTAGVDVGTAMQKNISSALLGGEGLFQTKVEGEGIAVLYSPVPFDEIQKVVLSQEKLSVDGNFALLRTEGVEFKVEKSSKSFVSTSKTGEGLLQTFSGSGKVWLAPTQGVYAQLTAPNGLLELALPPGAKTAKGNSNTKK